MNATAENAPPSAGFPCVRLVTALATMGIWGLVGCNPPSNPYAIGLTMATQATHSAAAGRLIVKFRDSSRAEGLGRSIGAVPISTFPQLGLAVLALPNGTTTTRAAAYLSGNPEVVYAEPDFRMRSHFKPDDPGVSKQWGLAAIGAFEAWDMTMGDPNVVVAVVDTGVDLGHPELRHQLVSGKTFVPGTSSPMDDNGHGTHVAGVIVAAVGNGSGVAGIAPKCRLMPVKALDGKGEGNTSTIVAGLLYAADAGARIINLSLGGGSGSRALAEAIRYAHGKGSLIVAAMGNDGKNAQEYPAAYAGVLSVGATSVNGQVADFSNYGTWISVSAPGDGIWSTMPTYETPLAESDGGGTGYGFLSGTSMATPYVAGVAALIASRFPSLPAPAIKAQIERTADNLGLPGFDAFFGAGQVNARRAVTGR